MHSKYSRNKHVKITVKVATGKLVDSDLVTEVTVSKLVCIYIVKSNDPKCFQNQ